MAVSTDKTKIDELLTRGVEEVIVYDNLKKKLESGKKLRVKFGIDPTGTDLHIGHAVPLQKLKQFQEMGHDVILLIGDYTAMIGDPTGRNETRPMLTKEQIWENMKTYVEQAEQVLNMSAVEIRHNSEWYKDKSASFMMELTGMITVARVLDREDFKKRLDAGQDIQTQELLYPLLQGYDSVALEADVEIGATDQKFNMLMGRKLQKKYDQPEQNVITCTILEGTDGEKKMSKTYGNYIGLMDSPQDMYGKTMSIPDELIIKYFRLTTDEAIAQIEQYEEQLKNGTNPRDVKAALASCLTRLYYGEDGAKEGREHFAQVIQSKDKPSDIAELKPTANDIVTVLVEAGMVKSTSEARRAVEQGGVKVNDEKVSEIDAKVKKGDVVQKGKRHFVRVA